VTSAICAGSGTYAAAFSNLPSGSGEWASCVALFDSYRVEKMVLEFVPYRNSITATGQSGSPMYVGFDPDNPGAPASSNALLGKANLRLLDLFKHWSYTVDRMPRVASASAFAGSYTVWGDGYLDTADAAATCSVQVFTENNLASMPLGTMVCSWIVHFVSRN